MSTSTRDSLFELLESLKQKQLIKRLAISSPSESQCEKLLTQLKSFQNFYAGGIEAYLEKAEKLITDFQQNRHELPNYIGLPTNMHKGFLGEEYEDLEEIARPFLADVAFVLVAGGLGERLGSKNIKISIKCEIITGITFMEMYFEYMKAFSQISGKKIKLFIMTSGDTHDQTVNFLKEFDYSLWVDVHIEMQDKVPAIKDVELNLDVDESFNIQTKPHGHGDVHFLIKNSKIIKTWISRGIKYVYFIQDTNPFSLPCLPVLLGSSLKNNHLLNFLGVVRKTGEPIGALVTDETGCTYNIEYNIFQNYRKLKGFTEETGGFCKYPGNINCFLIEINEYQDILMKISDMKEFINIKFDKSDPKKIASSWRIECLMQDIAFSISDNSRIHVTIFDRNVSFTTCKNNINSGQIASSKGLSSDTIVECENDIYHRNLLILKHCGVKYFSSSLSKSMENLQHSLRVINDIPLLHTPRVFIHPSFGILIKDIRRKLNNVQFDEHSDFSLILKGKITLKDCTFGNVSLWIENKSETSDLTLSNLKLTGREENVLQFVHLEEHEKMEGDIRAYKVDDMSKVIKIVNC